MKLYERILTRLGWWRCKYCNRWHSPRKPQFELLSMGDEGFILRPVCIDRAKINPKEGGDTP